MRNRTTTVGQARDIVSGETMSKIVQSTSRKRRLWFGAALAALVATAAQAQPSYPINVGADGLEPALLSLASQTKQQIFFPKALVAGLRAPALHGTYTPDEALTQILAGTGLRARRVSAELVIVERPVAARSPRTGGDAETDRPFVGEAQLAQADPTAPMSTTGAATAAPTTVDELRVTGSNIRGAPPASPLLMLGRRDLERSGQVTLVDALRALPENFGGGAGEGANTTGADKVGRNGGYGTALNLRGLGNNATLVLVNGRRLAGSGAFGDFVDVSTIPTGAVERVEVLLDGASAVYGSDAVGGVVNIIMRKNFEGAETRVLGGIGTSGEPGQAQVSQLFGKRWTGGGLVFAYEFDRRDNLAGDDRSFADNADLRPLGGTDRRTNNAYPGNILLSDPVTRALVPRYAIPTGQNGVGLRPSDFLPGVVNRTNQRQGVDILPKQTLNAVYLALDQDVGDRLQLSADARYSARRFKNHSAPGVSTLTVNQANPFYVSPIGAPSEIIAYSFADELPNPTVSGVVETVATSFGGSLRLTGDWRAEAYGAFAQEIDEVRGGGIVNSLSLNEALGTIADRADTSFSTARFGYFNPFTGIPGSNSPAVLAYIGNGFTINRSRSQVSSVSLQADGSIWSLPAGAVKLAVGGQARRETLVRNGANMFFTAAPSAQAPTDVARDVTAAFAELRVPLFGPDNARPGLERLDLTLAGRVEHYQSFGTTTNPKVGVLWGPTKDLQLRASYGRSFRAPALREAFDPSAYTPAQFLQSGARLQALLLEGGNGDLKPETATSWTAGFDYRPTRWPGLTLSASVYDVRFHNRIDRPVENNLANALVDPTLSSFVTRISPATNSVDRALLDKFLSSPFLSVGSGAFPPEAYVAIVDDRYVNTATLRVKGLDATVGYEFDLGDDHVALGANGAYVFSYEQQVTPTSRAVDLVNVVNFPVRFRGRATADWTRGRLTLGGAVNYVSAYHDALGTRIDDQPTFDLQARLAPADSGRMKGLSVLLNVRNVFDRDPPFYDNPVGIGYDSANGDPIGRFVSLQLTRVW